MRVAFVVPETTLHRETPSTVRLDRLARGLVDRGHDVTVLCRRWWDADDVEEFQMDGVVYRALGDGRRFSVDLALSLRRLSPDVVHAHGGEPGAAWAAGYGAKLARTPLVVEWYDADPRKGTGPRAVGRADRLIAPSRLVRTRLREAGADGDDVVVIPDPVEVDQVRATDPDEEYLDDVVYARTLDETANLESLLLGLAELREYDWTATVVGDGPARAEYERQTRDLRIDDRVRFVGEMDRTERIGVYRAARGFVHTARECVFATELLWALVCGCVGIVEYHPDSSAHELVEASHADSSVDELLDGGDRGFCTTTETEMVDVIRSLADCERLDFDDDFLEYDRSAVLERYLACYRDLVDDRSTP
jgi:glycosyltransferase involved in cell wall biosynthesis